MMAAVGCQKQFGQADVLQNRGGGENTKEVTVIQMNFGMSLCNDIVHCLLCASACRTGSWILNESMKIFVCFIV